MATGVAAAGVPRPPVENATVTPLPGKEALRVEGVIGPDFERSIRRALRRHPHLHRIVITSPGGMRAQAMRVGELANRRGMTVRAEGRCASACVLLWATAASREMTAGSRIGLHRSNLEGTLPIPEAMRAQLIRRNDRETDAVLLNAGFPARVVEAGAATPPTTMAWFRADDLAGVRFELLESTSTAALATAEARPGGTEVGAPATMTAP